MKSVADLANDPEVFLSLDNLELVGKGIADSIWYGMHRSRLRGAGVEFETHSDYQPGDDLRQVNWALYARQRRLYTKESRRETQKPIYLLLDASGSMNVAHGAWAKIAYAKRVLAAVAFLANRQGDSPSLGILRDGLISFSPPRSGSNHALSLCAELARATADGEGDIADALSDCQAHCKKRGFVIFVSDFFDDEKRVFASLGNYLSQGHEVMALQVLDPYEIEIPKTGDIDFIDSETGANFRTSAEPLFESHAEAVTQWRERLSHQARSMGIAWNSVSTDSKLVETVFRWFSQ